MNYFEMNILLVETGQVRLEISKHGEEFDSIFASMPFS